MWPRIAQLLVLLALGGVIALVGSWVAAADTGGAFRWPLPDWMPPPPVPADNPMSVAKVELGHYLFFDARLAGLNYMSCSTCHRPELGFTDGRPVAIGVSSVGTFAAAETQPGGPARPFHAAMTWHGNVLKHGPYTRELLRESAEKLELVQVGRGPPEEM